MIKTGKTLSLIICSEHRCISRSTLNFRKWKTEVEKQNKRLCECRARCRFCRRWTWDSRNMFGHLLTSNSGSVPLLQLKVLSLLLSVPGETTKSRQQTRDFQLLWGSCVWWPTASSSRGFHVVSFLIVKQRKAILDSSAFELVERGNLKYYMESK